MSSACVMVTASDRGIHSRKPYPIMRFTQYRKEVPILASVPTLNQPRGSRQTAVPLAVKTAIRQAGFGTFGKPSVSVNINQSRLTSDGLMCRVCTGGSASQVTPVGTVLMFQCVS